MCFVITLLVGSLYPVSSNWFLVMHLVIALLLVSSTVRLYASLIDESRNPVELRRHLDSHLAARRNPCDLHLAEHGK